MGHDARKWKISWQYYARIKWSAIVIICNFRNQICLRDNSNVTGTTALYDVNSEYGIRHMKKGTWTENKNNNK